MAVLFQGVCTTCSMLLAQFTTVLCLKPHLKCHRWRSTFGRHGAVAFDFVSGGKNRFCRQIGHRGFRCSHCFAQLAWKVWPQGKGSTGSCLTRTASTAEEPIPFSALSPLDD